MLPDDIAISVRNLTKTYRLFGHPGDRIKQFFSLGLKQYHREFTALKDVSFDIKKGETVGIVGRNGSGKSTLLQLICSILKPTAGTVQVNGRVSALLELGAGFNPEFTGRENVYFQGALMGFTEAQMDKRFDEIATFADIGEFIDQPVRTYSSGMFVRLAFSVVASFDPDILVVDEALAVGDMAFRSKCYARINSMTEGGTTLLFVSHDIETVKVICQRTLYIDRGALRFDGGAGSVCDTYVSDNLLGNKQMANRMDLAATSEWDPQIGKAAEIVGVTLATNGLAVDAVPIPLGAEMTLIVDFRILENMDNLTVAFHIRDDRQLEIIGSSTRIEGCDFVAPKCGDVCRIKFRFANQMRAGEYGISVGLAADRGGDRVFPDWLEHATSFRSSADHLWSLVGIPVQISREAL